jgi:hypothetical protein
MARHFNKIGDTVLNTILFADDQAIFSESEDGLQRAVNRLAVISNGFNIRIATIKKCDISSLKPYKQTPWL